MFTGIIEEIGRIKHIRPGGRSLELTVEASVVLTDVKLGDSIAVNGVCLTVTSFGAHGFAVDVTPETYRQTNLSKLSAGSRVNLERAMRLGDRFGGHIVQGHVDGSGVITGRRPEENAVVFTIEPHDPALQRHILARGSIAVDGISLTVVSADERQLAVSIIPHTLAQTVLADKQPGDTVNLETDIIGKYVEKLLGLKGPSASSSASGRLTEVFLAENGFI